MAIVPISTIGDRDRRHSFSELGGRGVFSSELEEALAADEIDVAVHSAKDLTTDDPDGLALAAVLPRADPRDAWCGPHGSLADVPDGARIGTASTRRTAQLGAVRPGLRIEGLRGNVDTRLRKRGERGLAAIVLAACGLDRLGLADEIGFRVPTETMLPEVGQGFIVLQTRAHEAAALAAVSDAEGMRILQTERTAAATFGGGCLAPVAAHAEPLERQPYPAPRLDRPARRQRVGGRERRGRRSCRARPAGRARGARSRRPRAARGSARVTVYLVGAGPGDPGLITVRGLDLVRRAEVLVYDRLIGNELLDEAPPGCILIDASKRPDHHTMTQEEIDACLVEHGGAGRLVVRLKGGDPFVFGRGGEEALALAGAGIPFEVVPGISSAIAAPAYAGIPVTHRNVAAQLAIITGHERPGKETSEIDWDVLARFAGTLVFLMGVGRLALIAEALIAAGKDPATPAAVVQSGTLPAQRTVTAPLSEIAAVARAAGIQAPAVTVVGHVAGLRDGIAWAEARPLHGRTIAVTRARAQSSSLVVRLRDLGARVIEAPTIRIEPIDGPPLRGADYDVVCVTSTERAAPAARPAGR